VGTGIAAGLLGAAGASAQVSNTPPNIPAEIKVIITLNGVTYSYPNGPTIPSYYVGFRDDGRIVFHLGALGNLSGASATAEPYHLPSHHVRIERDGVALLDATIPEHWWNAEWTYRSKPLAAIKTPAQLVAANRMFPFGDTGCRVTAVRDYKFAGPMDSAGITKYMPTTGERPDLGWVTDCSGEFMLTGNASPMIAWAMAAGSAPIHFRDESTGKPIDLRKYPKANCYDTHNGAPYLPPGPKNANGFPAFGGGWTPDQAHFPELSYVAYMATKDLGFLEDLQYEENFGYLFSAFNSSKTEAIPSRGQQRGLAWTLRTVFMAHVATADAEAAGALPASCLPSSYFKTLLDHALAHDTPDLTNAANQIFQTFPAHVSATAEDFGTYVPWEQDYMVTALAFGVLTGHTDWVPVFLFALGNLISRLDGASGWPPGAGTPYFIQTCEWSGTPPKPVATSPFTWKEAFLALGNIPVDRDSGTKPLLTAAQISALQRDPLNGGVAMINNAYMESTRAAMVMADYLDKQKLANVRGTYSSFGTCLTNAQAMFKAWGQVWPKVSVISRQV